MTLMVEAERVQATADIPWSRQAVSMHSHWYCSDLASSISDKRGILSDISTPRGIRIRAGEREREREREKRKGVVRSDERAAGLQWGDRRWGKNKQQKIKPKQRRRLTIVIGICAQNTELMAQHFQFHLDVGAIFLGEQHGEPCLDLGLLVEQLLDCGVEGRVVVLLLLMGRGRRRLLGCRERRGSGTEGRRAGQGAAIGAGGGGHRMGRRQRQRRRRRNILGGHGLHRPRRRRGRAALLPR